MSLSYVSEPQWFVVILGVALMLLGAWPNRRQRELLRLWFGRPKVYDWEAEGDFSRPPV